MRINLQKFNPNTGATELVELSHDPKTSTTRLFIGGFLRASRPDNSGLLEALSFIADLERDGYEIIRTKTKI